MACLRRLADPRDSLASAEIRTLVRNESPEDWLEERLTFLEGTEKAWLWGESGDFELPILRALAEARKDLPLLTSRLNFLDELGITNSYGRAVGQG